MIAGGSEQFVAANNACEASDFSAVLVKSDENPFSLHSVQSYSKVALFCNSAESPLGRSAASATELKGRLVSQQLTCSHLMATILRI